jgi:hypothetical protein
VALFGKRRTATTLLDKSAVLNHGYLPVHMRHERPRFELAERLAWRKIAKYHLDTYFCGIVAAPVEGPPMIPACEYGRNTANIQALSIRYQKPSSGGVNMKVLYVAKLVIVCLSLMCIGLLVSAQSQSSTEALGPVDIL